jgi:hypothetical protein
LEKVALIASLEVDLRWPDAQVYTPLVGRECESAWKIDPLTGDIGVQK